MLSDVLTDKGGIKIKAIIDIVKKKTLKKQQNIEQIKKLKYTKSV